MAAGCRGNRHELESRGLTWVFGGVRIGEGRYCVDETGKFVAPVRSHSSDLTAGTSQAVSSILEPLVIAKAPVPCLHYILIRCS